MAIIHFGCLVGLISLVNGQNNDTASDIDANKTIAYCSGEIEIYAESNGVVLEDCNFKCDAMCNATEKWSQANFDCKPRQPTQASNDSAPVNVTKRDTEDANSTSSSKTPLFCTVRDKDHGKWVWMFDTMNDIRHSISDFLFNLGDKVRP